MRADAANAAIDSRIDAEPRVVVAPSAFDALSSEPVTGDTATGTDLAIEAVSPPPPPTEAIVSVEAPTLAVSEQAGGSGDDNDLVPAQSSEEVARAGASAAQELIEVWRPGRRDDHRPRKPRHERQPRRPQPQATAIADASDPATALGIDASAAPPSSEAPPASGQRADNRQRRDRRTDRREFPEPRQRADRVARNRERSERDQGPRRERDERPIRGDRPDRQARGERADRPPRGDRPDRDPELRAKYLKGRGDRHRDREPDPNSPFAKLAALKEQLEANKEPR
jgi:ATP-dependent RNA helicase SUPV3L1/SUV3